MTINLIGLIGVSAITITALFIASSKMKQGFGPFNLKVFGLILISGLSCIIVLTEISSSNLTASISVLSAFAGYLFGLRKDDK